MAYSPEPGNRAYPLAGRDLVSGRQISLEDYRGKWVLLEFWASWCGPCVRLLPDIVRLHQRYGDRVDFALLSVSLDSPSTMDGLREQIRIHGITYPVLNYHADDGSAGTFDWQIDGVPTTLLLDPQGNIVCEAWVDESFDELLTFFLDAAEPRPPYGLSISYEKLDPTTYDVTISVYSPTHQPLALELDFGQLLKEYWAQDKSGERVKLDEVPQGEKWNTSSWYTLEEYSAEPAVLVFGEFGAAARTIRVTVPEAENEWYVAFSATLVYPGSEALFGGEGIKVYAVANTRGDD
ncbi:TlpA family protein disulfide reductase [bacterium]|nr:TlpA family protein disulfide reductase [bacterium]